MKQMTGTSSLPQGASAPAADFMKTVGQPGEEHVFQVVREEEAGFVLWISQCSDPSQPVEGTIRLTISQVEEFQKGLNRATYELTQSHAPVYTTEQKPRKAGQHWSDEDRRQLKSYIQSRTPFVEIAEALGRTKKAIVFQVLDIDRVTDDILYELLSRQDADPVRVSQAGAPPMPVVQDFDFRGHGGWTHLL